MEEQLGIGMLEEELRLDVLTADWMMTLHSSFRTKKTPPLAGIHNTQNGVKGPQNTGIHYSHVSAACKRTE